MYYVVPILHGDTASPAATGFTGVSGENEETTSNQEGASTTVMRGQLELDIESEPSSECTDGRLGDQIARPAVP